MAIGLLLGIGLTILEKVAPKYLKAWLPSPSGIGIAMIVPGSNAIAMFLGAAGAEAMRRYYPRLGETYTVPIGSGFLAGESLMGVLIIILTKIAGLDLSL
jgi:uncharacterized oligopeptide transporter (OPT) family protein